MTDSVLEDRQELRWVRLRPDGKLEPGEVSFVGDVAQTVYLIGNETPFEPRQVEILDPIVVPAIAGELPQLSDELKSWLRGFDGGSFTVDGYTPIMDRIRDLVRDCLLATARTKSGFIRTELGDRVVRER